LNFHKEKGSDYVRAEYRAHLTELLPSQRDFMDLKTQYRGFSGPVGSGKTRVGAELALVCAYRNAGRMGVLGAPTYPMLRDATLPALLDRLTEHKVPFDLNRQDMVLTLHECKSHILLRSLSDPDRLRGTNIAWFGIDEATYIKEASFLQLQARLRDPLAKHRVGFAVWTPKGFDWVWKRFVSSERTDNYGSIRAKPFENSHLPDGFYQNLWKSYSPQFAKQEVLGEYLNIFSGRAYQQFDRDKNVWPLSKPDKRLVWRDCRYTPTRPLLWALDFNINPAASVIAQTITRVINERIAVADISGGNAADVQLNVLDELFLENRTTYEVCDEFLERIEQLREAHQQERIMVYVYGDPAGVSRHSNANKTDWQIIKDFFKQHENKMMASFRVRTAHPRVKDRVNTVNWACNSATNVRRLLVHKRCKNLISDLEQVAWKANQAGVMLPELDQDKDPMRTHITDALGYLIEREWPMRPAAGLQPGVIL
jgi:hypothetical protein